LLSFFPYEAHKSKFDNVPFFHDMVKKEWQTCMQKACGRKINPRNPFFPLSTATEYQNRASSAIIFIFLYTSRGKIGVKNAHFPLIWDRDGAFVGGGWRELNVKKEEKYEKLFSTRNANRTVSRTLHLIFSCPCKFPKKKCFKGKKDMRLQWM
jgi:hypothetical protein